MAFPHLNTVTPFEDNVTDVLAEDQVHHAIFGSLQVSTLPTAITGSATAGSTGQTLVASGATFVSSGVVIGDVVYNSTDASYGIVKTVSSETQIITTPLKGGVANAWSTSDSFSVKACPNMKILLLTTDGANLPGIYVRNTGNTTWDAKGTSTGSNTGDNSPNTNTGLVHTTGDETIAGVKTLGDALSLILGTSSSATGGMIFKNATNANSVTIVSGATSSTYTLTLPTSVASAGQVLTDAAGDGVLSWATLSGFAWGVTGTAGSGTGITLTSSALGGGYAFLNLSHTASGTLTSNTTTQSTLSNTRTHTNASSITDNYIGQLFARTNTINAAGGTLISNGSVVNITGSDTVTTGALTAGYNLLKLNPSGRSSGSALFVQVANSLAAGPTNGHVSVIVGNTQSVAATLMVLDSGTSATAQSGLEIRLSNANTSSKGVYVNQSGVGTGAGFLWLRGGSTSTGFTATTAGNGSYNGTMIANNENTAATDFGNFKFINISNSTATSSSSQRASDFISVIHCTGRTSGSALTDNYNLAYLERKYNFSGSVSASTSTGSVMKLNNNLAGVTNLTDSTVVLELTQSNSSTGGHMRFNAYSGTPTANNTFWYDGTNFKYKDNAGTTKTITAT